MPYVYYKAELLKSMIISPFITILKYVTIRHCPYGHFNVIENRGNKKRVNSISKPTLLKTKSKTSKTEIIYMKSNIETIMIVFWTGGLDSYLALLYIMENRLVNNDYYRLYLLTTVDMDNNMLLYQNIDMKTIMNQVQWMKLDIVVIPLPSAYNNDDYTTQIQCGINIIKDSIKDEYLKYSIDGPTNIEVKLVFSDLRIDEIKAWKESMFTNHELNQSCCFPLFGIDYMVLQEKLMMYRRGSDSGNSNNESSRSTSIALIDDPRINSMKYEEIIITNVSEDFKQNLTIGDKFTSELVDRVIETSEEKRLLDRFGQNGEFYTLVTFKL